MMKVIKMYQYGQFNYSTHGKPGKLHIQDITLSTTTVDGYAVYSRDTLTTMNNINITGYSGDTTLITGFSEPAPEGSRWLETDGGATRIESADYSESHDATNPTLKNVTVTNCHIGLELQDSTAMYVKDCQVENLSDNGISLALVLMIVILVVMDVL